jgi:hypothetical protein
MNKRIVNDEAAIFSALGEIYGKENTEEIYNKVIQLAKKSIENQ